MSDKIQHPPFIFYPLAKSFSPFKMIINMLNSMTREINNKEDKKGIPSERDLEKEAFIQDIKDLLVRGGIHVQENLCDTLEMKGRI